MKDFKTIAPTELTDNFFKAIDKEWYLITAGTIDNFNTMTASWGTVGILWHKPVAMSFVRPTRFTFEFTEKNEFFTMSFFDNKYHDKLLYCGSVSGREVDKMKETGFIPIVTPDNGVAFRQARLIVVCKKIYFDDLKPEHFLIPQQEINKIYPQKDYHRMYIGEIVKCYITTLH